MIIIRWSISDIIIFLIKNIISVPIKFLSLGVLTLSPRVMMKRINQRTRKDREKIPTHYIGLDRSDEIGCFAANPRTNTFLDFNMKTGWHPFS